MVKKRKSTGVLSHLLGKLDKKKLEMTSNRMLVAAKIGNALEKERLTQKEFAVMMGRSESEISEWLSGNRNFTIDTLTEISLALNISLLDTSVSSAYVIPMEPLITSEAKKGHVEVVSNAIWVSSVGHITSMSKCQKVV
ncbi:MAG: helix-turn-helix domain-containing protein [Prevotella sp.]|nr:helix-turn-helix domain-containing protein [Prevotella sp.]